jgi:hypothetical protein
MLAFAPHRRGLFRRRRFDAMIPRRKSSGGRSGIAQISWDLVRQIHRRD